MAEHFPGLGPRGDRPRLNPGADLTALRLTPVEGFVLSRVDGTASYEEICLISGLGGEATLDILRRLKRQGIIIGPRDTVPPPAPPPTATGESPAQPRRVPTEERNVLSLLERLDDGTQVAAVDLLSGTDLTDEVKARIVRLHRRLGKMGPYEMLGLERDANRAAIKRAYYSASKELHPDRYFGKNLGVFREKLGDIFARLTESFQKLQSGQGDGKDDAAPAGRPDARPGARPHTTDKSTKK